MADNVARVSPVSFATPAENAEVAPVPTSRSSGPVSTPTSEPASGPASPALAGEQAEADNYRLTIESAENGRFVYTVSDPVTGKVVLQLPREVVQDLAKDPEYRGGNLLKTSV